MQMDRLSEVLNKEYYVFECIGRDVIVSRGMVIRLCQEGHVFRMLLLGGHGFRNENINNEKISFLKNYNILFPVFSALILALRINEPRMIYKYKISLESIGGFKFLDRYVKKLATIATDPIQTEPQLSIESIELS